VTAFLYVGLGGRPFWNSSILGPRFIASAFTAGPSLIIIAMQIVRRVTRTASAGPAPDLSVAGHAATRRPGTIADLDALARHLPELATVPLELRHASVAGAEVFEVNTGDVLLQQGARGAHAFFVLEGRVVVKREENGRFRIIRTVGAGEQFGEISAIHGTPRTATALAEEPTRVLRLPAESLRKLLKHSALNRVVRARMHDRLKITDRALMILRSIVQVSMLINVFLLLNELFKEFYTGNLHVAASRYLYFGLHGHHALVPWIWTAVACNVIALTLLLLPISRSLKWLDVACVLAIVGIWIEKGMGMVIPGFVPSPLGEIVEYTPTLNETLVCLGIWAFGLLSYTVLLKVAVPILQGTLSRATERQAPQPPLAATISKTRLAEAN
jgi:CRP-like cAMP-binding protein